MFFLFPIPAKYFVMIVGAMAFLSAPQSPRRRKPRISAVW